MKPPYTRMALAISLALLAGCSTVQRVNQTMSDTDTTYNQAQGHFQRMANGKPVSDITTQWINPIPITEPVKGTQLPGCAVTYTNPGKVSLNDLSAFITRTCRIPVVIAPDAANAISAGVTEKISGSLPAPDANGMVPLNQMGGANTPTRTATTGNSLTGLWWQGSLSGFLDNITTRLGLSWRYESGRIRIFMTETRSYPVTFLDYQTAFTSKVVSGTTTSSGSSGSGSTGGLSGDTNTSQSTATEMKSSLYKDLELTIKAMLTPGMGRMSLSAGMLTVTDTPQVQDSISRYIADRNQELNRQVVLNVKVFSVSKKRQSQLGIDWNAIFKSGSVGASISSAFTDAASGAVTGGVSILDGKFANSEAFLHALEEQANVALVTQQANTTTNMSPVSVQVGTQQDYAGQVSSDSTANVGTSTSIEKSTITTGFNMTMLPYIMPATSRMELQFSINMSDEPTMRSFTSGDSTVELVKTKLKTFNQKVILKSGQTLVLSGFQQVNNSATKQGVGSAGFFGLGGGLNGEKDDNMLVMLITPTLLGD
jgi:type IVB pilus formation R64 PilN family outer membrane protein